MSGVITVDSVLKKLQKGEWISTDESDVLFDEGVKSINSYVQKRAATVNAVPVQQQPSTYTIEGGALQSILDSYTPKYNGNLATYTAMVAANNRLRSSAGGKMKLTMRVLGIPKDEYNVLGNAFTSVITDRIKFMPSSKGSFNSKQANYALDKSSDKQICRVFMYAKNLNKSWIDELKKVSIEIQHRTDMKDASDPSYDICLFVIEDTADEAVVSTFVTSSKFDRYRPSIALFKTPDRNIKQNVQDVLSNLAFTLVLDAISIGNEDAVSLLPDSPLTETFRQMGIKLKGGQSPLIPIPHIIQMSCVYLLNMCMSRSKFNHVAMLIDRKAGDVNHLKDAVLVLKKCAIVRDHVWNTEKSELYRLDPNIFEPMGSVGAYPLAIEDVNKPLACKYVTDTVLMNLFKVPESQFIEYLSIQRLMFIRDTEIRSKLKKTLRTIEFIHLRLVTARNTFVDENNSPKIAEDIKSALEPIIESVTEFKYDRNNVSYNLQSCLQHLRNAILCNPYTESKDASNEAFVSRYLADHSVDPSRLMSYGIGGVNTLANEHIQFQIKDYKDKEQDLVVPWTLERLQETVSQKDVVSETMITNSLTSGMRPATQSVGDSKDSVMRPVSWPYARRLVLTKDIEPNLYSLLSGITTPTCDPKYEAFNVMAYLIATSYFRSSFGGYGTMDSIVWDLPVDKNSLTLDELKAYNDSVTAYENLKFGKTLPEHPAKVLIDSYTSATDESKLRQYLGFST